MIYNKTNYKDAKYLIGKNVICWTNRASNIYIGYLEEVEEFPFHFRINKEKHFEIKEKFFESDIYIEKEHSKCFQCIKSLEDDNGNFTFDFY